MRRLQVTCPSCNKKLNVSEKYFGKTIKCPGCQNYLQIPKSESENLVANPASDSMSQGKGVKNQQNDKKGSVKNATLGCGCLSVVLFVIIMGIGALFGGKNKIEKPSVSYSIINDDKFQDYRRSLDIRLSKRVSKEELEKIAYELKRQDSTNYERTFIVYYLPGMKVNAGGWATSHFNPDLEIRILGTTIEEEKRLKESASNQVDGKVLGRWRDNSVFPCITTLLEKDGKVFMNRVYKDGSKGEYEMVTRKVRNKIQYKEKNSKTSDYLVIKSNGDLAHGDREGIWHTSKKIK